MEITQTLKTEIYHALADFLEAYKTENTQVLAEKFGISGEFLEEIYEMLDFIEDKSTLCLFPVEEIDKKEGGGVNLEVYNYNNDDTAVGVEAHLWDNQEYFAIIKGCYNLGEQFPKFVFHYFES
ncbi:hypothetical protein [Capnocytophaga gingivalis]|jgi:hypothetical protein|uniref:hypothetical protein n=1 Tax=Capnocytophaga gingivalis TaxID=1017 RepID=UPI003C6F0187